MKFKLLKADFIQVIHVMSVLLPRTSDGFTVRATKQEDAKGLAKTEFDTDLNRFLALPIKVKVQWIKSCNPEAYDGWAVIVDGILTGRTSMLRGKRRGDGELAIVISWPFWGLKLGQEVAALLV